MGAPFELSPGEARGLVDSLLAGVDASPGRFSAHLVGPDDDAALLSLQVAADVFLDSFGNTPDLLRAEYGALLPAMTHCVVLDVARRAAVGTVIVQDGPVEELKSVVDLGGPPWSMPLRQVRAALDVAPGAHTAADLLLLAADRGYRGRSIGPILLYAGWIATWLRGRDRWTAILDDSLLRGLGALSGGAVTPLAPSRPYLGSPGSTPVTVLLEPARAVAVHARAQRLGQAVVRRTDLCPRLTTAHAAFQALQPARAVAEPIRAGAGDRRVVPLS